MKDELATRLESGNTVQKIIYREKPKIMLSTGSWRMEGEK